MFHTERPLVWPEALWGNSVEVEAGWHWRPILYEPPCALCPQGQFTMSLPPEARESTRGSHTYGVWQRLLCGPVGRKRHHALLIKSYKAVKSPEDRSPIGQKNSFGNTDLLKGCGKARVVPGWVGQQWLGQKHGGEELIRPLLVLPPPGIYAWADIRGGNWKTEGWRAQDTAEKRGHSKTCLSYWPWIFCARQRTLEHGYGSWKQLVNRDGVRWALLP